MTTNEKEILIPQKSLRFLWENTQPRIQQVQNPMICTQQSHQAIVLLMYQFESLRGAKMHCSETQDLFPKFDCNSGHTLATNSSTL